MYLGGGLTVYVSRRKEEDLQFMCLGGGGLTVYVCRRRWINSLCVGGGGLTMFISRRRINSLCV